MYKIISAISFFKRSKDEVIDVFCDMYCLLIAMLCFPLYMSKYRMTAVTVSKRILAVHVHLLFPVSMLAVAHLVILSKPLPAHTEIFIPGSLDSITVAVKIIFLLYLACSCLLYLYMLIIYFLARYVLIPEKNKYGHKRRFIHFKSLIMEEYFDLFFYIDRIRGLGEH